MNVPAHHFRYTVSAAVAIAPRHEPKLPAAAGRAAGSHDGSPFSCNDQRPGAAPSSRLAAPSGLDRDPERRARLSTGRPAWPDLKRRAGAPADLPRQAHPM